MLLLPPSRSSTEGVPPVVSTTTASSKVNDASTVSPGDQAPSVPGEALIDGAPVTCGGSDAVALLVPVVSVT